MTIGKLIAELAVISRDHGPTLPVSLASDAEGNSYAGVDEIGLLGNDSATGGRSGNLFGVVIWPKHERLEFEELERVPLVRVKR